MKQVDVYRSAIQRVFSAYIDTEYSHGAVKRIAVCDAYTDQYLLLDIGWDGIQRVHEIIYHVHIQDGHIWVESDCNDHSILNDLLSAGITRDQVRLGFSAHECEDIAFVGA